MRAQLVIICFLLACVSVSTNEQNEESLRMKRTSCFIIAKNYVSATQDKILSLLEYIEEQERMRYVSKMYAAMGQLCEDNISQSEMQQFYVESGSELQIQNYFYLLEGLDLVKILSNDVLTLRQTEIAAYHAYLQEHFRQREGEQGHQNEDF